MIEYTIDTTINHGFQFGSKIPDTSTTNTTLSTSPPPSTPTNKPLIAQPIAPKPKPRLPTKPISDSQYTSHTKPKKKKKRSDKEEMDQSEDDEETEDEEEKNKEAKQAEIVTNGAERSSSPKPDTLSSNVRFNS